MEYTAAEAAVTTPRIWRKSLIYQVVPPELRTEVLDNESMIQRVPARVAADIAEVQGFEIGSALWRFQHSPIGLINFLKWRGILATSMPVEIIALISRPVIGVFDLKIATYSRLESGVKTLTGQPAGLRTSILRQELEGKNDN